MLAAVLGIAAVSCGSPEKMAEMAENVIVKCEPAVLEVKGGNIDATVSVTYPEDYFHPKAILEVTPVIVYEGGEQAMEPFMFQGEKVKDNYDVVPSDGTTITRNVHFTYVPGMEKCYLELRGTASYKAKSADLPSKKVADGANTTYMLVCQKGKVDLKADNYQEIIKQTAEGQILYNINSADVRNNQLTSKSIKDFQAALDEIKANERKTLTGTDIVAYASPDGKEADNAKLSNKRSASAEKAFKQVTKKHEVAGDVNVTSVAEDWEGIKAELVTEVHLFPADVLDHICAAMSISDVDVKSNCAVLVRFERQWDHIVDSVYCESHISDRLSHSVHRNEDSGFRNILLNRKKKILL